jgi:hypothetical protein
MDKVFLNAALIQISETARKLDELTEILKENLQRKEEKPLENNFKLSTEIRE